MSKITVDHLLATMEKMDMDMQSLQKEVARLELITTAVKDALLFLKLEHGNPEFEYLRKNGEIEKVRGGC